MSWACPAVMRSARVLSVAPVAIAALPYLATDRRRSAVRYAAAALTLFALVTGFTIGIPYLLPAGLLVLAGSLRVSKLG